MRAFLLFRLPFSWVGKEVGCPQSAGPVVQSPSGRRRKIKGTGLDLESSPVPFRCPFFRRFWLTWPRGGRKSLQLISVGRFPTDRVFEHDGRRYLLPQEPRDRPRNRRTAATDHLSTDRRGRRRTPGTGLVWLRGVKIGRA